MNDAVDNKIARASAGGYRGQTGYSLDRKTMQVAALRVTEVVNAGEATSVAGSIDVTSIHAGCLVLEGWIVVDGCPPATPLLLTINDDETRFEIHWVARKDIAAFMGPDAGMCGFRITAPLRLSPFDYPKKVTLRPDIPGAGDVRIRPSASLQCFEAALTTQSGFFRHIQNPGTRVRHEGTLTFLATRAVALQRKQPALQASALCVLAWRNLLDVDVHVDVPRVIRLGRYLLAKLENNQTSLMQRWYVSLANALAFLALKNGHAEQGHTLFQKIVEKTETIDKTWLCVPNGTTARFMLGYIALGNGDLEGAKSYMKDAFQYFESRLPYCKIVNTWSFDELLEVGRLGQQAFQIYEMIRTENNSSLLNSGSDFEAARITTQLIARGFKQKGFPIISVAELISESLAPSKNQITTEGSHS